MPDVTIPAGLETDPEVRAALKRMTLAAIESATDILENAAPAVQQPLVRSLVTGLARSLVQSSDTDELKELRELVAGMYANIEAATAPE